MLIICGKSCTGKSSIGNFLDTNYDYLHIEASSVYERLYLQYSSNNINLSLQALDNLNADGFDVVAKEIASIVEKGQDPKVCITGIRFREELLYLTKNFPLAKTVLIYSSHNIRKSRFTNRNKMSEFEFEELNRIENRFHSAYGEHFSYSLKNDYQDMNPLLNVVRKELLSHEGSSTLS